MLKNENEIKEAAKNLLKESFSDGEKGVYSQWKSCEEFFIAGYQIYGSRNAIFPLSEIPVWADKVYPGGFPERIKRATASIIKLYDSGKLYSIQTISEQYGIAEGDIISILHSHDLSRTETARELTVAMYRQGNDLATIVKAVQGNNGDRYASVSQIQGWIEEIYRVDECDD